MIVTQLEDSASVPSLSLPLLKELALYGSSTPHPHLPNAEEAKIKTQERIDERDNANRLFVVEAINKAINEGETFVQVPTEKVSTVLRENLRELGYHTSLYGADKLEITWF